MLLADRGPADAEDHKVRSAPIYHTDPNHLWNRLHAAMLIRTGPDQHDYGQDRLEPLLWLESKYLLEGESGKLAVEVLEEFVRRDGAAMIQEPLQRAFLQRDLWLVHNWLAVQPAGEPRERLASFLAEAIRQVALTPKQIAELPDSYALAVASGQFADRFDPKKPNASYLPSDLFQADGPWVCVGRTEGPTAPMHLREGGTNRFTNSAFLIFLRVTAGREATLAFLKQLNEFKEPPLLPNPDEATRRSHPFLPNSAMPQLPKGSEVALVRRAMLVDNQGRVAVSPLTESVQLRVSLTDTPMLNVETLEKAGGPRPPNWQVFSEFRLSRANLFTEQAGGLRDASSERDFKTGFNAHQWDDFEQARSPFPERSQPFVTNRSSCIICHRLPGVYGLNSIRGFEFGNRRIVLDKDGNAPEPYSFAAMTPEQVEGMAVKWKEQQVSWTELRKRLTPER